MAYIKPTEIIVNGRGLTSTASSATGISPVTLNVNTATTATLGIIQVGSGLSITPDGVLSATGGGTGNGYTGSAGSTGTQGSIGFTGSTGTQGNVGFTGSAGANGSTGTQGNTGFTGSIGSTGTQGNIGFTGSTGSTGTQGTIGYTGSVGAGYAGSTGYTGSQGESSFTWGTTPPGSPAVGDRWYDTNKSKLVVYVNDGDSTQWVEVAASGFLGQSGYTGSAGVGYAGSQGSTGTQGSIGFTGSGGVGSTGPKISSVVVTDSSYNTLDDTAVALTGGYIKIAGSGFESGCQVLLGTTLATSVSYISSSEVRAQLPASSTGTYIIYLVNTDGGTAIRVNAVTFSATPAWTTGAALTGAGDTAISIQLAATDATSFAVAAGSSLPSGVTLSSGGLLSGTITGLSADTTYNFTIVATDAELQDSTRAFTFEITVGEPYFKYVSLLLAGNGTNNKQNNTFLDSSTNNFTITRNGNTSQGTFSPYGSNWSNYFDGTGDYLSIPSNTALQFGAGDFTIECWFYDVGTSDTYPGIISSANGWQSGSTALRFNNLANRKFGFFHNPTGDPVFSSTNTFASYQWHHVAVTRSGTSMKMFVNGVQEASATVSASISLDTTTGVFIGSGFDTSSKIKGYISDVRVVKGTAVYTTTFTPSTIPLTAISGTSLLTCQSNRFIDNSSNLFTITKNGDVSVQRFSPLSPSVSYSSSTIGGSAYFDGTGDSLSAAYTGDPTGNFTIEFWWYPTTFAPNYQEIFTKGVGIQVYTTYGTLYAAFSSNNSSYYLNDSIGALTLGAWNHIAVVKNGTSYTGYINGIGTALTSSSSVPGTAGNPVSIGYYAPGNTYYTTGYISDARYVVGTAVYTSNFTPTTAPLTAIANTQLLCNFTNAGILDNAMQNNIETVGDAKISTTQYKFGSGSLYFDGTGDYCFIRNTHAFLFGSGDFTIELWAYIGDTSTRKYILGPGTDTDTHYDGFGLEIWNQQLSMWASSNGTGWDMLESDTGSNRGATLLAANTWYHIAVTRSGNTFRSFVNGVVEKTFTVSGTIFSNATVPYNIGRTSYLGGNFYYNGYMDDLRVTRGYARYTGNFTPPTSALPLK
jgi:hypothetical protein